MSELNIQQINYISEHLRFCELDYEPLREELLDHICTAIEIKMEEGQTFHKAADHVFELFNKDEIQKTQQQTIFLIHQKRKLMTKISFATLLVLFLTFTTVWALQQDPPSRSPINGTVKISSTFGYRMHPIQKVKKMHKGIDIKVPIGTPVVATAAGEVIQAVHQKKGHGIYILIKHDEWYSSKYAQLSEIKVAVGDRVEKGQVIGLSGNSGVSTAPHLHYEVIKNGKHINPGDYLKP